MPPPARSVSRDDGGQPHTHQHHSTQLSHGKASGGADRRFTASLGLCGATRVWPQSPFSGQKSYPGARTVTDERKAQLG